MRRSLTRFDVTCLGLNAIVGSGVFALPDDLYRAMGAASPLVFVVLAIGLLPVALCYAEAASYGDRTGGPYVYAHDAFGAKVGFVVVWMCFVNAIFSFSAVAAIAAATAAKLVPALAPFGMQKLVAVALIVFFAALNYVGAKPGALAVDAFTVAKFGAIIALVAALAPAASSEPLRAAPPHGWSALGPAVFVALFAAQGFEVAPVPAGEARMPQRDLPFAIVSSLLAASVLYVVVQTVLVAARAPIAADSETPLVDTAYALVPWLGLPIAVGGLISTIGFVSGNALGTPRYLFAAALDRHLPAALAAVHPRFATPHVAVVATGLLAAAVVIPFDYRSLIGISNVAVAVQYLATCVAVPVLRRRGVPGRRIPGGPVVPVFGALVSLWVFTQASFGELEWAAIALAISLVLLFARRSPGV
jgi:amino acid transporter